MKLRETSVISADAVRLLTEYFESRALGFPADQGVYHVAFPPPEHFVSPRGVFVLVETDDGRAIGCGGIRRIADGPAGEVRYEVKHVWVEPGFRGNGWAGILMADLEDRARRFGAHEIVLDTNASLTAAARLYARLGYRSIDAYNDNPNATNWYAKSL
ncbi:GNAT family N-acetyltransferase [Subtercola sp. YIM 133946]|uniref:GNAT family N-acetyltransferase n=1 Tax=Subtercola sp. YIM 133946 TaxID=3118909 RepID=UPI002F95D8C8